MKPVPEINDLTRGYWHAAVNGELKIQRCDDCSHWQHFPREQCNVCGGKSLSYQAVSGQGVIETWSLICRSFVEGFQDESPYVVAWIGLKEQPGLRVFANLFDVNKQVVKNDVDLAIGQTVRVFFTAREGFGQMPNFYLFDEGE